MQKTHKIALVANTSWSVYNFRLGLIRALIKSGIKVVVIAPKDGFTANLIAEGIQFEELRLHNYGTNPVLELFTIRQLYKIYRKHKPSLIYHYTIKPNLYGTMAAALCGIPSIMVTTGLGHMFMFKNLFVRWLTRVMYRTAAKFSKQVWFLNDNDRDLFIYKRIVKPEKTKILKSEGIDLEWFKLDRAKDFNGPVNFLYAGRLLWDKGIAELIEVARRIKKVFPEVSFDVLGFINQTNPNSVPYAKILEWQNEGVINYLGETHDVRPYLSKAHCLVFPSYREGMSRILMEAAAMETPIITTDNVGCRDIVDHNKNGFLFESKDVDGFEKCLKEFIEMESQDKMVFGKLGRKKMLDEFDEKGVIQAYYASINAVLNIELNLKQNQSVDQYSSHS